MNGKTILVQCKRLDLGTNYARFALHAESLDISYMAIRSGLMLEMHSESLPFSTTGEAQLLHDGNGWNVSELYCWVRSLETWEDDDE